MILFMIIFQSLFLLVMPLILAEIYIAICVSTRHQIDVDILRMTAFGAFVSAALYFVFCSAWTIVGPGAAWGAAVALLGLTYRYFGGKISRPSMFTRTTQP